MKIHTVTVTGADNSVTHEDLIRLAMKFPFVEFGILMSPNTNATGKPRFPSIDWIQKLSSIPNLKLSAHVCGNWVNQILAGEMPPQLAQLIGNRFSRIQLNTHGVAHFCDPLKFVDLVRKFEIRRMEIIFQNDGANDATMRLPIKHGLFNASCLFDMSHGAGVLPNEWPKALESMRCGYAGGLSPFNLAGQIVEIEKSAGDKWIWIDAETHLRSDGDRKFDLEHTEAFLSIASAYVA